MQELYLHVYLSVLLKNKFKEESYTFPLSYACYMYYDNNPILGM